MIEIGRPRISSDGNRARLSADVAVDGESHELWFEVEEKYKEYLCAERSDAFVLAMMQYAFHHRHDIKAVTPMTDRLYEQIVDQFL